MSSIVSWNKITNNIYVGDIFSLADFNLFNNHNIKHIISLVNINNIQNKISYLKNINITHSYFEDNYKENIITESEKLYSIIDKCVENNENILVHCQAGKSRSVGVVIYYLIKKYNMSYDQACNIMNTHRPVNNMNSAFKLSLNDFANNCHYRK